MVTEDVWEEHEDVENEDAQWATYSVERRVSQMRVLCGIEGQATDKIGAGVGLEWRLLKAFEKGPPRGNLFRHAEKVKHADGCLCVLTPTLTLPHNDMPPCR